MVAYAQYCSAERALLPSKRGVDSGAVAAAGGVSGGATSSSSSSSGGALGPRKAELDFHVQVFREWFV